MHVGQTIGHEKDRRSISCRSRRARSLFWVGTILAGAVFVGIVPEFYFAEKGFGVASLVCGRLSLISVLFSNNCVSSWRQDEKVRYHGTGCDSIQKWIQTMWVMVFGFDEIQQALRATAKMTILARRTPRKIEYEWIFESREPLRKRSLIIKFGAWESCIPPNKVKSDPLSNEKYWSSHYRPCYQIPVAVTPQKKIRIDIIIIIHHFIFQKQYPVSATLAILLGTIKGLIT